MGVREEWKHILYSFLPQLNLYTVLFIVCRRMSFPPSYFISSLLGIFLSSETCIPQFKTPRSCIHMGPLVREGQNQLSFTEIYVIIRESGFHNIELLRIYHLIRYKTSFWNRILTIKKKDFLQTFTNDKILVTKVSVFPFYFIPLLETCPSCATFWILLLTVLKNVHQPLPTNWCSHYGHHICFNVCFPSLHMLYRFLWKTSNHFCL